MIRDLIRAVAAEETGLRDLERALALGTFEVGPDGKAYARAGSVWVPEDLVLLIIQVLR